MTYGEGALQTLSTKQKLNTLSSCESELVGVDDAATKILWTKQFMEAQGYCCCASVSSAINNGNSFYVIKTTMISIYVLLNKASRIVA